MNDLLSEYPLYFIAGLIVYVAINIFVVKTTSNFMRSRLERTLAHSLEAHLQAWHQTALEMSATLSSLETMEARLGRVIASHGNQIKNQFDRSNAKYHDDLEKMHLALDDLLESLQNILERSDLIRKQQKEIENWQRRAQRN